MKTAEKKYWDQLLQLAEVKELGRDGLSTSEVQAMEQWLEQHADAQKEYHAIAAHLQYLRNVPPPTVPHTLTTRCLSISERKTSESFIPTSYKRWATTVLASATAVFLLGIWVGFHFIRPTEDLFVDMMQKQNQWLARLEIQLAAHYREASFSAQNPWYPQIQFLKQSSQVMETYYQQYGDDPVIQRGLAVAVQQNILVLQGLSEYLEKNERIPNFDFKRLDLSGQIQNTPI